MPTSPHPTLRRDALPVTRGTTLRHLLNWVNLSTPIGLALATAGRSRIRRGPARSYLADHYRFRFPVAGAFTVGDVVITRHDLDQLAAARPTLLTHELVHAQQWAVCLGLPFLPLYVASMGWSWLRTGDRAARSVFERHAGLELGGYVDVPTRPLRPVLARVARRLRAALLGRRGLDAGLDVGRGAGQPMPLSPGGPTHPHGPYG